MTDIKLPELLSPAGNTEKLKAALLYGADAVYVGGVRFGMRSASRALLHALLEPVEELKKAELEGYRIEEGLENCVAAYISRAKAEAKADFGNARGVRNCFESVVKRMNARLADNAAGVLSETQLYQLSEEEISTIRREDME